MTRIDAPDAPSGSSRTDARVRRVIGIHFDPDLGTPYWLDRQSSLGIDARREVRSIGCLSLLGTMRPSELAERPLMDFIPRRYHAGLAGYVLGQTGGTTGGGAWTIYRPDEFEEAFITPFSVAAAHVGFPRGERWLYVGPSGPHIIGKVVRGLAGGMGSADPFSVDFDARWAKKLPEDSLGMRRYLSHVVEQAMGIIHVQEIGVIFTTPRVLGALSEAMTQSQRSRVRGLHYGGMELRAEVLLKFQREVFPNAVHLSGYGNTLFGCTLELSTGLGRVPCYYPYGTRLVLEVVDCGGKAVAPGECGVVCFTRLDESFLIVRMLERDAAITAAPMSGAPAGYVHFGVSNPHSPASLAPQQARGLY